MPKHEVQCRFCKEKMDISRLKEGDEWVMPVNKFYYHTKCYDEYTRKKSEATIHSNGDTEFWLDAAWCFMKYDLKYIPNYQIFAKQWGSFEKQGFTSKGIYFAIRYFYLIKHGDVEKSNGGIGIVPYIYNDSANYWIEQEQKASGILALIESQIEIIDKGPRVHIKRTKMTKNKKKFDLDSLDGANG